MSASDAQTVVETGWPAIEGGFVAVLDPETRALPEARAFVAGAVGLHEVAGRPTPADAAAIEELLDSTGVRSVVSLGAGLVVDAVKLAVFERRNRTGELVVHDAIPCGPEPYRAVTPFTMYDEVPGSRGVAQEDWLRPRVAAVVPDLLDGLSAHTVALFAGDSAVHAFESLLSKLTTDESKRHAVWAAKVFIEEAQAEHPDPARLAHASIEAAVAFDTTKLGLAHALSRPLGIATGESHDAYNLMLGAPVARFWGTNAIGDTAVGEAFPTMTAAQWSALFDGYRMRAGLPASLCETKVVPADREAALEWAPKSSGIPNLPAPLRDGDLRRVMADAWSPKVEEARA